MHGTWVLYGPDTVKFIISILFSSRNIITGSNDNGPKNVYAGGGEELIKSSLHGLTIKVVYQHNMSDRVLIYSLWHADYGVVT